MRFRDYLSLFFNKYKPDDYWLKRGKVYQKEFVHSKKFHDQEKSLIEFLKQIKFDSVLEFGCGFGRITKTILENFPVNKYTAFDLSPDQILNAKSLCKNFDNVSFVQRKIQDFHSDEKFDLVLGSEVLLHIKPEEIKQVIEKLLTFTNRYMVNLDYDDDWKPKMLMPHNFIHQYRKIYSELDVVKNVDKKIIANNGAIFCASIN